MPAMLFPDGLQLAKESRPWGAPTKAASAWLCGQQGARSGQGDAEAGAAAGLDDEDLALVHVDVRRRAAQCPHRDSLFDLVSDHRQFPLSNRCSTAIWTTMRLAASRITRLREKEMLSTLNLEGDRRAKFLIPTQRTLDYFSHLGQSMQVAHQDLPA